MARNHLIHSWTGRSRIVLQEAVKITILTRELTKKLFNPKINIKVKEVAHRLQVLTIKLMSKEDVENLKDCKVPVSLEIVSL